MSFVCECNIDTFEMTQLDFASHACDQEHFDPSETNWLFNCQVCAFLCVCECNSDTLRCTGGTCLVHACDLEHSDPCETI